jgi:hypothetical protein
MGKGQCYKVVSSASLLTTSKLVVKTTIALEFNVIFGLPNPYQKIIALLASRYVFVCLS